MNTIQNNKLRMFLATQAVLQEGRETWKGHEVFAEAVGELSEAIVDAEDAVRQQTAQDGATNTKEVALERLGEVAYDVAGAVYVYATRTGNTNLAGRVDFTPAQITSGSQADSNARCTEILAAATEVAPAVVRYGITADLLELLRQRIRTFHEAQTRPRTEQSDETVATKAVAAALARAGDVLTEQLDRMVRQFRVVNLPFVDKYQSARRIVHLAGSGPVKSAAPSETPDNKASSPPAPVTPPGPGEGPKMPKAA